MQVASAVPEEGVAVRPRLDSRVLLVALGGLLVLVGYLLPFYAQRITRATALYSDGTSATQDVDVLISGQKALQDRPPRDAVLEGIQVATAPIAEHSGSAVSWVAQIVGRPDLLSAHASFVATLVLPLIGAAYLLWFAGRAVGRRSVPRGLIAPGLNVVLVAAAALVLSWPHQFDFSLALYSAAGTALAPGIGFVVALTGMAAGAAGLVRLRGETRARAFSWWHLVLAVTFAVWFLTKVRPHPFLEIFDFVSDGIVVTLRIVATSFVFILAVSLLGGLGRISRNPIIYGISSLYVELIRGIPLLVQLLFIWYAFPQVLDGVGNILIAISPALRATGEYFIELRLDPFVAAVMGLTICYGAYGSEIFRAGISSIHHGQVEAARSLGMTSFQAMRYVILPQAVRVILPPVGNEFVALLKDSSLVSVLAVSDLTRRGREYMSRTFLSFDTWILVALCYLVLTLFSSRVVEYIESKSKFER